MYTRTFFPAHRPRGIVTSNRRSNRPHLTHETIISISFLVLIYVTRQKIAATVDLLVFRRLCRLRSLRRERRSRLNYYGGTQPEYRIHVHYVYDVRLYTTRVHACTRVRSGGGKRVTRVCNPRAFYVYDANTHTHTRPWESTNRRCRAR